MNLSHICHLNGLDTVCVSLFSIAFPHTSRLVSSLKRFQKRFYFVCKHCLGCVSFQVNSSVTYAEKSYVVFYQHSTQTVVVRQANRLHGLNEKTSSF